jgi:hypothetical protein
MPVCNKDELLEKISYFMGNPDVKADYVANLKKRILEEDTCFHRISTIFNHLKCTDLAQQAIDRISR